LAYAKKEFGVFGSKYIRDIQRLMGSLLYTMPRNALMQTAKQQQQLQQSIPLKQSPYADLTSPDLWNDLVHCFMRDYCALLGLSTDPPLQVCVNVGATAIPTMIKLKSVLDSRRSDKVEMWSLADELPVEIPLPKTNRYHSIFACPVSREQTTDWNPPMMLPCGHVISRESLARLSKGKGGGGAGNIPVTASPVTTNLSSEAGGGDAPTPAMPDPLEGISSASKVKCPYCPMESTVGQSLRVQF
jgi:hypothetical protein